MSKHNYKYNESYFGEENAKPDEINFDDAGSSDFAMMEKNRNASKYQKRAKGKKNRDRNKYAHEMALYGEYDD